MCFPYVSTSIEFNEVFSCERNGWGDDHVSLGAYVAVWGKECGS